MQRDSGPRVTPPPPRVAEPAAFRTAQARCSFDRERIFLNIPYAPRYTKFELAIMSTATAYGLVPVMAKQRPPFEVRLKRILEMIYSCAFGLTDLSYSDRMNMPFELGVMLAVGKNCFIVSKRRYRALKSISDLNLGDVFYHEGQPGRLIRDFATWIEHNCTRRRVPLQELKARFEAFVSLRKYLGQDEFDRRSPQEIAAMLNAVRSRLNLRLVGTA